MTATLEDFEELDLEVGTVQLYAKEVEAHELLLEIEQGSNSDYMDLLTEAAERGRSNPTGTGRRYCRATSPIRRTRENSSTGPVS